MKASRPEIIFLSEFPEAAGFCESYVVDHWELPRSESSRIVKPCSRGHELPFILVARAGGLPIGMIMARKNNPLVDRLHGPWMCLLYVVDGFRKRGIGTALLERGCEALKELGHSTVYIDTIRYSDFYRKRGWTFVSSAPWGDEKTNIFSKNM